MKLKEPKAKENLLNRLRRIEGQVRGVQNMISEERECREIMQQMAAVRSAMQGATLAFVQEYASTCLLNNEENTPAAREELLDNLVTLLGKVP